MATRSLGACWIAANGSVDQISDVGEQIETDHEDRCRARATAEYCGADSCTSPAVNVMLFQASAEKSEPVCATQMRDEEPERGRGGQTAADCPANPRGVQKSVKLSRAGRRDSSRQQAEHDQPDERAGLRGGEDVLDELAVFRPRVFVHVRSAISSTPTNCAVESESA